MLSGPSFNPEKKSPSSHIFMWADKAVILLHWENWGQLLMAGS